jgi:hypothetical protein
MVVMLGGPSWLHRTTGLPPATVTVYRAAKESADTELLQ